MQVLPSGAHLIPGYLDRLQQNELLKEIREVVRVAPLYKPTMPKTGKPLSVQMSNCGKLGWVCDKQGGYRYQTRHPLTAETWPPIPQSLIKIWHELAASTAAPEACLINYYQADARMGLHQDKDEETFDEPVVSISLGDTCLFRLGSPNKGEPTISFKLHSGDALVLSDSSRLAYHGVDRIYADTSTLLKNGGRINLTLRRVTRAFPA